MPFKHILLSRLICPLLAFAFADNQAAAPADQGSFPGLPQRRHTNCGRRSIYQCRAKLHRGISSTRHSLIQGKKHTMPLEVLNSVWCAISTLNPYHQCKKGSAIWSRVIHCAVSFGYFWRGFNSPRSKSARRGPVAFAMRSCLYSDDWVVKWWLKLSAV